MDEERYKQYLGDVDLVDFHLGEGEKLVKDYHFDNNYGGDIDLA